MCEGGEFRKRYVASCKGWFHATCKGGSVKFFGFRPCRPKWRHRHTSKRLRDSSIRTASAHSQNLSAICESRLICPSAASWSPQVHRCRHRLIQRSRWVQLPAKAAGRKLLLVWPTLPLLLLLSVCLISLPLVLIFECLMSWQVLGMVDIQQLREQCRLQHWSTSGRQC